MSTLNARLRALRLNEIRPAIRWQNPLGSWLDRIAFDRSVQGAQELERLRPGAVAALDERRLNIADPGDCAFGQTFGAYNGEGTPVLRPSRAMRLGVVTSSFINYPRLTRMWKLIIPVYRAAA